MKLLNVRAGYGKRIIINGADLEIGRGEIISFIGPNGGGKSTLLKTISGQIRPLGGSVFIGEDDIKNIPLKDLAKSLSIVTTKRVRPELMTCFDVVMSGRIPYTGGFGTFSEEDYLEGNKAAKLMKIDALKDTSFEALSDGQKQRALIARAICQKPEYLVMDEPTSYLDIRYRVELMDVIKGLSKEGITIIMSLHEIELALSVSSRVLLIKSDGEVLLEEPHAVLENGIIKDLYSLTDEMYKKVEGQLRAHMGYPKDKNVRHSSFFVNRECEYYPCHDLPDDKFSCMFCYCPLYDIKDCGGEYTYTEKGVKNCKNCTFPHDRNNYGMVIKKLKEKMYGNH
ncbi:ATP-binding cassette domain-containing protein [Butyrivibrio sp. JL13D10]|uniref:ATP-binding cassette domain-containing protein n=1 Tax=Butyrivibrio sp. JL13D10 TaxID=3236815 RepID=UPI0038B5FE5D